jgi:hypothetical protein
MPVFGGEVSTRVKDVHPNLSLSIWPQPSSGNFNLRIASPENTSVNIIITNITGQKVKQLTSNTNKDINVTLDCPKGLYIVTVSTGNERQSTNALIK